VGLLQWFRNNANRAKNAVFHPLAELGCGFQSPWRLACRHFPVFPIEGEHLLRPGLLDNPEVLLEGGAICGIDLVMLVRQGAVNVVRLLRHDVNPAPLVAAGESCDGASSGHVVEHRDVLGHPNRVCCRQYDAELADPDALGLHREVEI
jgi:hypothetical protein